MKDSITSMNWKSRLGLIDATYPTLKTSSRSVPILMPSNYKDSIRYGHITLEEPLQHDHIRAHSRIEETNNVCAGLKCTSPCMPIVLLSANLSKLR
jgi:hypothetical protein